LDRTKNIVKFEFQIQTIFYFFLKPHHLTLGL
jgi:hypothetical protein